MTFQELSQKLPNGFHDAELVRFEMDYLNRRITCNLLVWIGDMENESGREMYRPARLILDEVAYLAIEPPDIRYNWLVPGAVVVDTGEGHPRKGTYSLPDPPPGRSAIWFYLRQTNSFLNLAVGNAFLEWTGPEENRGKDKK